MNTKNPIVGTLIILGISWVTQGCSSKSSACLMAGCAESVTLMSPTGNNLMTYECRAEQKATITVTPNNSVVVTCSCPPPDAGAKCPPTPADAGVDG